MKSLVFSVYDTKAAAFLPPFFMPQVAVALRALSDCVNDPAHAFGAHPEDYVLHHIADFDDVSGELSPLPDGPTWKLVTLLSAERDFVANGSLPSGAEPPHILPETGPTNADDLYGT